MIIARRNIGIEVARDARTVPVGGGGVWPVGRACTHHSLYGAILKVPHKTTNNKYLYEEC